MPNPKPNAQMKIDKNGVRFESNVDATLWTMNELIDAALSDVGRYLVREMRKRVRNINRYLRKSKYRATRYQKWVRKRDHDLQIGVENTKKGANRSFWGYDAELGVNGQPKRAIMYNTVKENIDMIRTIEAQYLTALNDERQADQVISDAERQNNTDETSEE